MAKVGNLTVVTGTYQQNGQTKKRYENVGSLMQGQDGSYYCVLKKTFNPAGVNAGDGKDSIILSVYADNNRQNNSNSNAGSNDDFESSDWEN